MHDIYQQFETTTLSNGLTVHCLHWPERAGVQFQFGIHSGATADDDGKEGTAHFVEHLVSSNALLSFDSLKDFFESRSGHTPRLGATGHDFSLYGFHAPADAATLKDSLNYFGHMLLEAKLEKEIEHQREIILGEFKQYFPTEYRRELTQHVYQSVFPNTFMRRLESPLGTPDTIKMISQPDLQTYYDTHYTPANMSIVAVGEITLLETLSLIENSVFGSNKPGGRTPSPELVTSPPLPTTNLRRFHEGELRQGMAASSYESFAQLPGTIKSAAISVTNKMLNNLLFNEIRATREWSYSVGCGSHKFPGFYHFNLNCPGLLTEADGSIAEVVNSCIEQLQDAEDSFAKAKQWNIARKRFTDSNMLAVTQNAMFDALQHNRIVNLTEELTAAEEVDMEGIREVLSYLKPERRYDLVCHP